MRAREGSTHLRNSAEDGFQKSGGKFPQGFVHTQCVDCCRKEIDEAFPDEAIFRQLEKLKEKL